MLYILTVKEVRSIFVTPVAWILLTAFAVQSSLLFSEGLARVSEIDFDGQGDELSYTLGLFNVQIFGLYDRILDYIYLYVPMITMGIFSREFEKGTFLLLRSAPVSLWQTVLSKYLATIAYFVPYFAVLASFVLIAGAIVDDFDYTLAFVGLGGIILLVSAYCAIGVLVSSLTDRAIAAAMGTLAITAFLSNAGSIGQTLPVVADIMFWFDIGSRAQYLAGGLVVSKDVAYILTIIPLCLIATALSLDARVQSGFKVRSYIRSIVLVIAVALFGLFTSLPWATRYWDASKAGVYSLPSEVRSLVEEVKGSWSIRIFVDVLEQRASAYAPTTWNWRERSLFEQFIRVNHRLDVEYIFYFDDQREGVEPSVDARQRAERFARDYEVDASNILPKTDAEKTAGRDIPVGLPVYQIVTNDGREFVRTFDDVIHRPRNAEFAAGLRRIVDGPKSIGVLTTGGRRDAFQPSIDGLYDIVSRERRRTALMNHGFDIVDVSDGTTDLSVLDLLLIADAAGPFAEERLAQIDRYLNSGGDFVLLVDEDSVSALGPILDELGLAISAKSLSFSHEDYASDVVFAEFSPEVETLGISLPLSVRRRSVTLVGGYTLSPTGSSPYKQTPVVTVQAEDFGGGGEDGKDIVLAYALERDDGESTQRGLVLGDADLLSSFVLSSREFDHSNVQFLHTMLNWITRGAYPVDVSRPLPTDNAMRTTLHQTYNIRVLVVVLFPLVIILLASALLRSRLSGRSPSPRLA